MKRTLVLNADFSPLGINPLSVIHWQDAIRLEYKGHATSIEYYDEVVHSPSVTMFVPAVLTISTYVKVRRTARFSDKNLLIRDNYTCQYCGEKFDEYDLTQDHVVPKKFGGKTTWENIVLACGPCNWNRGHDIKIQPIKRPYKPSVYELDSKACKRPVEVFHPSWVQFLTHYWTEDLIVKKY